MIVIPPVSEFNEYFESMAESMWDVASKNQQEMCSEAMKGNRTLVIRCDQQTKNGLLLTYFLHYRLYNKKFYCFIEEPEPEQTKSSEEN